MRACDYALEVAVCTWNRAVALERLLQSFLGMQCQPSGAWRLIIVDNNSNDETRSTVIRYEHKLPILYLFEPQQGLSFARNRALAAAKSDLLIFTDDDVTVPDGWLCHYEKMLVQYPEAAFFGGPIVPVFAEPTPQWVGLTRGNYDWLWAAINHGDEVAWLNEHQQVFGANMAFRLSKCGGQTFDTKLGRLGAHQLAAEEAEFIKSLQAKGQRGLWVGAPAVMHHIPIERLSEQSVQRAAYGLGRSFGRLKSLPVRGGLAGMRLRMAFWSWLCKLTSLQKKRLWLRSLLSSEFWRGYLDESRTAK